jgi:hypothetical protein
VNTSEVIVAYLQAAGIGHVFGYPGDPSVEFLEAARRAGLQFVLGSREGTSGLMAEAYGQLTGRPSVCLSTLGPGSTNLVNAVANAWLDRAPMIAISGQIETRREPTFTHQVIDPPAAVQADQQVGPPRCSRTPSATSCARRCGGDGRTARAGAPDDGGRRRRRRGQRRRRAAAAADPQCARCRSSRPPVPYATR